MKIAEKRKICLIGLGSIGMTHLTHIDKSFDKIIIVDFNSKVIKSAKKNFVDFPFK